MTQTFPRSAERRLRVDREAVPGRCPACGSADLRRYRVLSEGGWWLATKCQDCLRSIDRVPDAPLGSYVPLGTTVGRSAT